MSHNESLFYSVRECEIYNSFDCDKIKTTKKIELKLTIHEARAQGLRVAKKLAWRLLLLSKKRCVEKGKDDYVLKLFEIPCFQNGNTSLKHGVNFFFSFLVGSL
jgi:hypothetical protein